MRATGALPTEQRCKDMNIAQWLWYYFNIIKDEEENRDRTENYLDYLGHYINPKMAKAIDDQKRAKANNGSVPAGFKQPGVQADGTEVKDVVTNSSFEEELAAALKQSGEEAVTLSDSETVGNAYETEEDFIARVNAFAKYAGTDAFYKRSARATERNKLYQREVEYNRNETLKREAAQKKANNIENNSQMNTVPDNHEHADNTQYDKRTAKFAPNEDESKKQVTISDDDSVIMQTRQEEEMLEFFNNMPVGNIGPVDNDDLDYFE